MFGESPLGVRLPALISGIALSVFGLALAIVLFGKTWKAAVVFVILALLEERHMV
jgi:hypothetical protein